MNKKIMLTPVVAGITFTLMTAAPVFAANQEVSATQKAEVSASANMQVQSIEPYLGKKITKVTFIGEGEYKVDEKELYSLIKQLPGEKLEQKAFENDLRTIYEKGDIYDIRPRFKAVPEGVQLVYDLIPNPRYTGMQIVGNTVYKDSEIKEIFGYKKGQVLNVKTLSKKALELEGKYRQDGYIRAQVTDAQIMPNGELKIKINECNVENFKIKGNLKTKDYVITRELRLKKGKPFNAKLAKRSMERVYNLGYFEDVNIRLIPGQEPGAVEVEIEVVEMNTGSFGIGAGYSDSDGFVGMLSVADKNFRGTGDSISASWEFGLGSSGDSGEKGKRNYKVSYRKPWLDEKETAVTFGFYSTTNEYVDYDINAEEIARYDKKSVGQDLTFSRSQGEYVRNFISLKNRNDDYEGANSNYSKQYYESSSDATYGNTAAERRAQNFGNTRSVAFSRVLDTRDNYANPTEGKRISYTVEYAGLGGDFEFTKYSADYRYYYKAGSKNVLALNVAAGFADGDVPLSQRFAVGGADTLRGYENNQFRGDSMLRASLEYRIPLMKRVQGVVFTDYGYAWDETIEKQDKFDFGLMKLGYGLGFRISTPVGPLRLDYGIGEDDQKFHFSFGTQF